jgi:PAS domain S-box-containing protein
MMEYNYNKNVHIERLDADARLDTLLAAKATALVMSLDGTQIFWATPEGAGFAGIAVVHVNGIATLPEIHPLAKQISSFAHQLPVDGPARLVRMRLPGSMGAITCRASRFPLPNGARAVLVVVLDAAVCAPLPAPITLYDPFAVYSDAIPVEAAVARAHAPSEEQPSPIVADEPAQQLAQIIDTEIADEANGTVDTFPASTQSSLEVSSSSEQAPVDIQAVTEEPVASTQNDGFENVPLSTEPQQIREPEVGEEAAPQSEIQIALPLKAEPDVESVEELPQPPHENPVIADKSSAEAVDDARPEAHTAFEVVEPAQNNVQENAADMLPAASLLPSPTDDVSVHIPSPEEAPLLHRPVAVLRLPLRFVWQSDAQGELALISPEIAEALGLDVPDLVGKTWLDLAQQYGFDASRLLQALARQDTWSGVIINWPVQDHKVLPVELAGLPVFDRERNFQGFRGFGVVREGPHPPSSGTKKNVREPLSEPVNVKAHLAPTPEAAPLRAALAAAASSVVMAFPDVRGTANATPVEVSRPTLNSSERTAFHEIARALGANAPTESTPVESEIQIREEVPAAQAERPAHEMQAVPAAEIAVADSPDSQPAKVEEPLEVAPAEPQTDVSPRAETSAPVVPAGARTGINMDMILEGMPLAVLVHRLGAPLFANRMFFELTGFEDLGHLAQSGIDSLFDDSASEAIADGTLMLRRVDGDLTRVEVKLHTLAWEGERSSLMLITPLEAQAVNTDKQGGTAPAMAVVEAVKAMLPLPAVPVAAPEDDVVQMPVPDAETLTAPSPSVEEKRELNAILDTATDGVMVLDSEGRILKMNRSAVDLFGFDPTDLMGRSFTLVLSAESHRTALDYLDGLKSHGIASVLNEGREVVGISRKGGAIPLFMTLGRISEGGELKFCIVLRDIHLFKKAEEELRSAKLQAERASSQKSDFLARVSHEVRTPLNAILGFAEVMMEERFGPLGNERYKDYLKDIHASGNHVISLVNDLLDLSKIEAGKLELDFTSVSLNDSVTAAVTLLQPQANRSRIIIRTSLAEKLPGVVADSRSMKQIVINLLSNAVKFTPAGGQIIVSTGLTDLGQAVIRVRDSGVGMNEKEIATALEPFRQLATTHGNGGTGLGLPLTKALVEANRATFAIQSAVDSGTLVEVIFPPTRVLAE